MSEEKLTVEELVELREGLEELKSDILAEVERMEIEMIHEFLIFTGSEDIEFFHFSKEGIRLIAIHVESGNTLEISDYNVNFPDNESNTVQIELKGHIYDDEGDLVKEL